MPQISWSLNLLVQGGPKIATSDNVSVEAYDTIEVVIPSNDPATQADEGIVEVDVQPGDASQLQLLLISSDYYGSDLTYKTKNVANELSDAITLDGQQLFLGAGMIGLLKKTPNKIVFTNKSNKPANVRILVGRKV